VGTIAFAGVGMLLAELSRRSQSRRRQWPVLVLLFLGGMAYPLDKLPAVLETFAKALPAAALSKRSGRPVAGASFPTGELAVLVAWAIAAAARGCPLVPLGGVRIEPYWLRLVAGVRVVIWASWRAKYSSVT